MIYHNFNEIEVGKRTKTCEEFSMKILQEEKSKEEKRLSKENQKTKEKTNSHYLGGTHEHY